MTEFGDRQGNNTTEDIGQMAVLGDRQGTNATEVIGQRTVFQDFPVTILQGTIGQSTVFGGREGNKILQRANGSVLRFCQTTCRSVNIQIFCSYVYIEVNKIHHLPRYKQ